MFGIYRPLSNMKIDTRFMSVSVPSFRCVMPSSILMSVIRLPIADVRCAFGSIGLLLLAFLCLLFQPFQDAVFTVPMMLFTVWNCTEPHSDHSQLCQLFIRHLSDSFPVRHLFFSLPSNNAQVWFRSYACCRRLHRCSGSNTCKPYTALRKQHLYIPIS